MEKEDKEKNDNSKRVLIVDDEMFIREIYRDVLETKGILVDEAPDGDDAIEMFNSQSYDLILLDIMMPNMDGVTLLATIKENPPANKQGPIIITTNLEPDSLMALQNLYKQYNNDPLEVGVVEHIVKANVEPEDLVNKIVQILAM